MNRFQYSFETTLNVSRNAKINYTCPAKCYSTEDNNGVENSMTMITLIVFLAPTHSIRWKILL